MRFAKLKNHKLFRLFLTAVLIRLLLTPFFAHPDILKTYRRSFKIAFQGQSALAYFLSIVPHTIQAGILKISSLLIKPSVLDQINSAAVDIDHINLLLFVMKLPYLLAEILFWLVVKKHFKLSDTAWKWLLFNPIVIYSVYMFGRYESFVLLFMALFLVAVNKEKIIQAFSWLTTLILTRFSLVLILPTILLLKLKQLKKISLVALGTLAVSSLFFRQILISLYPKLIHIFTGSHASYLTELKLPIGFGLAVPVFWIVLVLLIFKARKIAFSQLSYSLKFGLFATLLLTSFYSTSLFHPQYFSWIIFPLTLVLNSTFWKDKNLSQLKLDKINISLLLIMGSYFLTLFFWNTETTLGLLFPVFSGFKFTYFSPDLARIVSSTGRIILSASLLYLSFNLIDRVEAKVESQ
jgi:hypothetical protein